MAADPGTHTVYVANANDDGQPSGRTVSVINGSSKKVIATVKVGPVPLAAAVDTRTHQVYVIRHIAEAVSVITP